MAFHAVFRFFATENMYLNLFDTKKRVLNIETFVQLRHNLLYRGLRQASNSSNKGQYLLGRIYNQSWPQKFTSVRLRTLCRPADQACSGRSGRPPQPHQSCSGKSGKPPCLIKLELPDQSGGCNIKISQTFD